MKLVKIVSRAKVLADIMSALQGSSEMAIATIANQIFIDDYTPSDLNKSTSFFEVREDEPTPTLA